MAISAVQYLKIAQFESEVVYEAKTDKVSKLLVDKDEYPSMTKVIVFHYSWFFSFLGLKIQTGDFSFSQFGNHEKLETCCFCCIEYDCTFTVFGWLKKELENIISVKELISLRSGFQQLSNLQIIRIGLSDLFLFLVLSTIPL